RRTADGPGRPQDPPDPDRRYRAIAVLRGPRRAQVEPRLADRRDSRPAGSRGLPPDRPVRRRDRELTVGGRGKRVRRERSQRAVPGRVAVRGRAGPLVALRREPAPGGRVLPSDRRAPGGPRYDEAAPRA